jgi:hypothetical protein
MVGLDPMARVGCRNRRSKADAFILQPAEEIRPDWRRRTVRYGVDPECRVQTGIATLAVQRRKVATV